MSRFKARGREKMKRKAFKPFVLLAVISSMFCPFTDAKAWGNGEIIQINTRCSDGKGERAPWRQWVYSGLPNRRIKSISITMQNKSNYPGNTYVNLRFGKNGQTLDNGKRVRLPSKDTVTKTWNLGGARSNGKDLVLNVYKGEVQLYTARVVYEGASPNTPQIRTQIRRNPMRNRPTTGRHPVLGKGYSVLQP